MKRISLLFLVFFLSMAACKKESKLLIASVRDGGDPAVDGCGWLMDISSETYKPENLPEEFKVDGMDVQIKYEKLDSMADCGFSQDVYDVIHLDEIKALTK
jgi:hypothetical protein